MYPFLRSSVNAGRLKPKAKSKSILRNSVNDGRAQAHLVKMSSTKRCSLRIKTKDTGGDDNILPVTYSLMIRMKFRYWSFCRNNRHLSSGQHHYFSYDRGTISA